MKTTIITLALILALATIYYGAGVMRGAANIYHNSNAEALAVALSY